MVIVMAKLRDILVLLGIGLAGYFMLKYIAKAKKEEEKAKEEEQKTIQSIRTQHETEQIKTQPIDLEKHETEQIKTQPIDLEKHETEQIKTQPIDLEKKEKEEQAFKQYTEHQIACETLYNDFYRDCLAYGGNVVDSESLHLLSSSYNVVNERVICDKKYYCVIIYEEEFRRGGRKPEPEPRRRYMT